MQRKFSVLRIVSAIFKVLGWIVLVVGLLGACLMIALGAVPGLLGPAGGMGREALGIGAAGLVGGVITGLGVIFFSILYFLMLYAFGDLIHLLIALEENTRITAERLTGAPPPAS